MGTRISKKVNWKYLLLFSLPTIGSQAVMLLHSFVDGIFVSRLVDPIALSAVNIVYPFYMFAISIGIMFATGGNALFAKKLGEGLGREAKENFSLVTLATLVVSVLISVIGLMFPGQLLNILVVDEVVFQMTFDYLIPILIFSPTVSLAMFFIQAFVTEGKPHISTISNIAGFVLSVALNFLLIAVFDMGLTGAAIATGIGSSVPCVVGLGYFAFNRKGSLCFVKPKIDLRALIKSTYNGLSEIVGVSAVSITGILMNNIVMRIQGAEAVAALGVIMIGQGIIGAVAWGYGYGVSPIISYNYGKDDIDNLKRIYKSSMWILLAISVFSVVLGWSATGLLIGAYGIPIDTPIYDMAFTGFRIFTMGFLFMMFNIFASVFFTALNNGKVSTILSLFRTLVFTVISLLVLPQLFGLTGAWAALPVAEVLSIVMSVYYFKKMGKVYKYTKK
jgi:putative MATE family efflux protein